MSHPLARFLEAKLEIDARAFHRPTFEALARELAGRDQRAEPLAILEPGCGIGTQIERLLALPELHHAVVLAFDLDPALVEQTRRSLPDRAARLGLSFEQLGPADYRLKGRERLFELRVEPGDLLEWVERAGQRGKWDLVAAHALLDLFPVPDLLPRLVPLLKPGGLLYAPITFDGGTAFLPPLDPELDRILLDRYHASMLREAKDGRRFSGAEAGRDLLAILPQLGAEVIESGASDWLVVPGPEGLAEKEQLFLRTLLGYLEGSVAGWAGAPGGVAAWIDERRRQIENGTLGFTARNLDVLARVAG